MSADGIGGESSDEDELADGTTDGFHDGDALLPLLKKKMKSGNIITMASVQHTSV